MWRSEEELEGGVRILYSYGVIKSWDREWVPSMVGLEVHLGMRLGISMKGMGIIGLGKELRSFE